MVHQGQGAEGAGPAAGAGLSGEEPATPPGWERALEGGCPRLRRSFRFPDFKEAMAFAGRVSGLAEELDHHPSLLVEWGRVTVSWWTHRVGGLTDLDLQAAISTDSLVAR